MSCAVPGMFAPIIIDDLCYIDGGVKHNFPINHCLRDHSNSDEIIAIKLLYNTDDGNPLRAHIKSESTLLDFISVFTINAMLYIRDTIENKNIENTVNCYIDVNPFSLDFFMKVFSNSEIRKNLLETGEKDALQLLSKNKL
jgi:predicted acylesterase/phospholipase RssA